MSEPKAKFPLQHPAADPKVDAAQQDVITNNEESNKIVNNNDAVADTQGVETMLSESEPSAAVNADRNVTNSEEANGDEPVVN